MLNCFYCKSSFEFLLGGRCPNCIDEPRILHGVLPDLKPAEPEKPKQKRKPKKSDPDSPIPPGPPVQDGKPWPGFGL